MLTVWGLKYHISLYIYSYAPHAVAFSFYNMCVKLFTWEFRAAAHLMCIHIPLDEPFVRYIYDYTRARQCYIYNSNWCCCADFFKTEQWAFPLIPGDAAC